MKRVLDNPNFPPDKYARGKDGSAIIIPSLPEDCAMRVILFSHSAPRCAQVCKSWQKAAARCYEYIFNFYRRNPKINPFVPAGFSPYEAVKLTYRTVMDRTHAPHIDPRTASLCRSVPLFLSPVLATVEDMNLIHCFKEKLQPWIPYNERPVLEGAFAQQSSTIRDWVKNHSVLLNQRVELSLIGLNLTTLPPEIFQCTTLRQLRLARNKLAVLPPELFKCTTLRMLSLSRNELVTLPREIGNLKNLDELGLVLNPLTTLPEEVGQLTNLETLWLSRSYLNLREHPFRIGVFADLLALDQILGAFDRKGTEKALQIFEKLPAETKKGVYEELYKLLPLQNKYDGCAEHAFLRLHGQDAGDPMRQQAIENFIRR